DRVALLDVVVTQGQTTLEALADLGDVVLLPPQRRDLEVVADDHAVAQQPSIGVATHQTVGDHAAGDVAEPAGPEDGPDLGAAEVDLLVLRLQQALQRRLDLLDRLVDDGVVPDLDALVLGQLRRLALRPDVAADDDRAVDGGEVDVALGDRPDAPVQDAQVDLVADVQLQQGVLQRLHRTRHVALDDQVERLPLLQDLRQVLEADPLAAARELSVALA